MRRTIFIIIALVALSSCRQASELPPIDAKYATEFIMPDPERLSMTEREYIQEMRDEYNDAILQ